MITSPLVVIVAVLIVRIIIAACESYCTTREGFRRLRISKASGLIANNFIDSKQLFVKLNKELPNVMLINGVDVKSAFSLLLERLGNNVRTVYRHEQFDFSEQQIFFNMVIIVLNDKSIIEVGRGYVELLYTSAKVPWAESLVQELSAFQLSTIGKASTSNVCVTGFAGQIN
jgi:hypothetical protein